MTDMSAAELISEKLQEVRKSLVTEIVTGPYIYADYSKENRITNIILGYTSLWNSWHHIQGLDPHENVLD